MCWQDVRINRSQYGATYSLAMSATPVQILPANPLRVAIIFGWVSTNRVMVLNRENPSVNVGFSLPTSMQPIVFHIRDFGTMIQDAWFGVASGATPTLTYAEVLLPASEKDLISG